MLLDVFVCEDLAGPDQSLPASARVKQGINRDGKAVHFYLNYSSETQTLTYAYGARKDLLTERAVAHGQSPGLKPWDAAIAEEKSERMSCRARRLNPRIFLTLFTAVLFALSVPFSGAQTKRFTPAEVEKRAAVSLNRGAFSFYDVKKHGWPADPGEFDILVGSSSEKIELQGKFRLAAE